MSHIVSDTIDGISYVVACSQILFCQPGDLRFKVLLIFWLISCICYVGKYLFQKGSLRKIGFGALRNMGHDPFLVFHKLIAEFLSFAKEQLVTYQEKSLAIAPTFMPTNTENTNRKRGVLLKVATKVMMANIAGMITTFSVVSLDTMHVKW